MKQVVKLYIDCNIIVFDSLIQLIPPLNIICNLSYTACHWYFEATASFPPLNILCSVPSTGTL
jgi:hypothetical protein